MITLDMCLDYIRNKEYGTELTKAQKRFLSNLCEGKLTNTPRNFGKTFVINLYAKCLDYYTDSIKWKEVDADDYISLKETIDGFNDLIPNGGYIMYNKDYIVDAYKVNSELAMREYNFDEADFKKAYGEDLK